MMQSDRIDKAFQAFPRRWFLPEVARENADMNVPIGIGYGQTNSQPSTVRKLLVWLEVRPGDMVLDVGSGSGWTSALLGYLAGEFGRVFAVEKIPELVEFGEHNCRLAGITNVEFFWAEEDLGLPTHRPYDRILVSAAADELPHELVEQFRPGGKLVIPVGSEVLVVEKQENGELSITPHPGFAFVPLVR